MTTITVDTDGVSGDYSSLNAAVAALPNPLTDDYTIELSATTSVADTTPVTINVTPGVYTLTLIPASGQKHGGTFNASIYYGQAEEFLTIQSGGVVIDGVQFRQATCTSTYRELITVAQSSGDTVIKNCILTTVSPSSRCSAIWSNAPQGDVYLVNNLIYGWDSADNKGYWIYSSGLVDEYHYIYNCTFVDCTWSIRPETILEEYVIAKNTGVAGNWEQSFGDASHPMTTESCSELDPVFVDSLNRDYHLDLSDTVWKQNGQDLSSDSVYPVTTDYEGELRGSVYDIGADQSEIVVVDSLIGTDLVSGSSTLSGPGISQTHSLEGTEIVLGSSEVGSPIIGQTHAVVASDFLSSSPMFSLPVLSLSSGVDDLVGQNISVGLVTLGTPALNWSTDEVELFVVWNQNVEVAVTLNTEVSLSSALDAEEALTLTWERFEEISTVFNSVVEL
jgi:hypothetical protein